MNSPIRSRGAPPDEPAAEFAADIERLRASGMDAAPGGRSLAALQRMACRLAHDLNNALAAIQGHCEIVLKLDGLPALARDCVEDIRSSAARTAVLSGSLARFSGLRRAQTDTVDLNAFLREMEPRFREILGPGVSLRYEPFLWPLEAVADKKLLADCALELASNARDAMPGQGAFRVLCRPGQGRVSLEFSDSGEGMSPDAAERAFEPFFTTRRDRKGLGLSRVYGAVCSLGGTISLDSLPGRGTTAVVTLPAAARVRRLSGN